MIFDSTTCNITINIPLSSSSSYPATTATATATATIHLERRALSPVFNATALHQAAYRGNPAMVTLLLDSKADLTLRTKGGHLPIHNASNCYHIAVVHLLLLCASQRQLSLDYRRPNKHCQTTLIEECSYG